MSVPPPPPLPPPVYYPQQPTTQAPNSNANVEEGRPASSPQPQAQSPLRILWISVVHNLTQLCLGGVIISALVIPNLLDAEFSALMQHIILCTVGYFIVMAQAILAYSPVGWAISLKHENKKFIHSTMQIIGSILVISGSAVQIANTKFALESSHSICGLIATIFTVINLLAGIFNLFINSKRKSKLLKTLHVCLGSMTIIMAFIALILAFHLFYRDLSGDKNANLAISLAVCALVGILFMTLLRNSKGILKQYDR